MSFAKVARGVSGLLILVAIFIFETPAFAVGKRCQHVLRKIPPAKAEQLADFRRWYSTQQKTDTSSRRLRGDVYITDINNDCHNEYVNVEPRGSRGYLALTIFARTNGSFRELKDLPPLPANLGKGRPWQVRPFVNVRTRRQELFGKLRGKTYMFFPGSDQGAREAYIWKGAKIERACGPDWAAFQRRDFWSLYDAGLYSLAKNNLTNFLKACETHLGPERRIGMLGDLAAASLRTDDRKICLAYVGKAKGLPGFDNSAFKASILQSEELCGRAPASKVNDFRWLLSNRFDRQHLLSSDWRYDALLAATVPDLDVREIVRETLWFPDFERSVGKQRYVTLFGCRPYGCQEKALVWADTQMGVSAFAINNLPAPSGIGNCFAIGSRTLMADQLPAEFWTAFRALRNRTMEKPDCVFFIGESTDRAPIAVRLGSLASAFTP